MTINTLLQRVGEAKRMDKRTLYRHLQTLNIKPLGARQRPQNYPPDAAERILQHLGLAPVRARNNGTAFKTRRALLPTMPELRAERKKARGK